LGRAIIFSFFFSFPSFPLPPSPTIPFCFGLCDDDDDDDDALVECATTRARTATDAPALSPTRNGGAGIVLLLLRKVLSMLQRAQRKSGNRLSFLDFDTPAAPRSPRLGLFSPPPTSTTTIGVGMSTTCAARRVQ
jgi:hypothetical protein